MYSSHRIFKTVQGIEYSFAIWLLISRCNDISYTYWLSRSLVSYTYAIPKIKSNLIQFLSYPSTSWYLCLIPKNFQHICQSFQGICYVLEKQSFVQCPRSPFHKISMRKLITHLLIFFYRIAKANPKYKIINLSANYFSKYVSFNF